MNLHSAKYSWIFMILLMVAGSCGNPVADDLNPGKDNIPGNGTEDSGKVSVCCVSSFQITFSSDFLEACDVEFVCVSSGGLEHREPVMDSPFRYSFKTGVSEFPYTVTAEVRAVPRNDFPKDPFRNLNLRYNAQIEGAVTDLGDDAVRGGDSMEMSQKVATDGENLANVLELIFPKIYRLTFARTSEEKFSVEAEILTAQ